VKKFILFAVAAIATLGANAQSKVKPGTWSIQPKLGATITSITNLDYDTKISGANGKAEYQTFIGATTGAEAEYQVTDRFSIAAGVGYIMQGKQWDDYKYGSYEETDQKIELGYINIPVVANYYIFKGFAIKTGAQFAFLIEAKEKGTIVNGTSENTSSIDVKDNCNTFDFSIPVGVSYEFDNHIVIDARYNIGITNVNKTGSVNCHNSVFLATVGYKFRL